MLGRAFFKIKQTLCRAAIVPKPRITQTKPTKYTNRIRKQRLSEFGSTHMTIFESIKFSPVGFLSLIGILRPTIKEMDLTTQQLKPPARVRGMTFLDKSQFNDEIKVPGIKVPMKSLRVVLKHLKKHALKMKKISQVVELEKSDPDFDSYKMLLFDPRKLNSMDELNEEVRRVFENENVPYSDIEFVNLKLSYENWNFQEVMQAVMPEDFESVTSYSAVGHIAHFNLREHTLPFKHLIGEVLLDKMSSVKTVVNKLNTIDNTYRTFQMEIMAGEDNFVTQVKENGCAYELDFSKVYWNSRLGGEHDRMTAGLSSTDIVFDVFAGIGPFAVPAVKRKARVFANDLNPFSYESLVKNVELNNCDSSLIKCYNLDGREFIQTVVKDKLTDIYTSGKTSEGNISGVSILMNLPALAYTFLDAFKGLLNGVECLNSDIVLPRVHCYCFTNIIEAKEKWNGDMDVELKHRFVDMIEDLKDEDLTLRIVRDVAPQKVMMCVTFKLTQEILCGAVLPKRQLTDTSAEERPAAKYQKLETCEVEPLSKTSAN